MVVAESLYFSGSNSNFPVNNKHPGGRDKPDACMMKCQFIS
jgi:hypothetical protein